MKSKKEKPCGKVEVDVSGAVAQTSVDSVFAFANGESYSIIIFSKTKKLALEYFRLFAREKAHENFYFRLYISCLVILFVALPKSYNLVLDTELYGQDEKIRGELKGLLKDDLEMSFKQIGRKSPAHLLAKSVFLKQVKPSKVISFGELKWWLLPKNKDRQLPKSKLRIR